MSSLTFRTRTHTRVRSHAHGWHPHMSTRACGCARVGRRSPLLLHVYGAYGHPLEVYFKAERLCLLNRGWTLAFAHVRYVALDELACGAVTRKAACRSRRSGGGELGREWYTQGKLQRKQNTFDDFVAVARGLAADQFSSPSVMAAKGISAGGLVCGYTALHHPDLFRAMVLKVRCYGACTACAGGLHSAVLCSLCCARFPSSTSSLR